MTVKNSYILHLLHQYVHSVGIRGCLHIFLKVLWFLCACGSKRSKTQKWVRKTVPMIFPNLHLIPAHHHVRICCIISLGTCTCQFSWAMEVYRQDKCNCIVLVHINYSKCLRNFCAKLSWSVYHCWISLLQNITVSVLSY